MKRGSLAIVGLLLLMSATGAALMKSGLLIYKFPRSMAGDLMCCGKCLSAVKWF